MKRVLFLTILIGVIILALVGSFAWFYKNLYVEGENTRIQAADSLGASVLSYRIESKAYNGATGIGCSLDPDAPYMVDIDIDLRTTMHSSTGRLKLTFNEVVITKDGYGQSDLYMDVVEDVDVYFTWRVYFKGNEYFTDGASGLLVSTVDGEALPLLNGLNEITLRMIYLSEENYQKWLADSAESLAEYESLMPQGQSYLEWVRQQSRYFDYEEFAFSAPRYMRTSFFFDLNMSVDLNVY